MTWPTAALGDVCDIISGATPRTSEKKFWGGNILWTTPKDLSDLDGAYLDAPPRTITEEGLKSCAASLLPKNSILLSSRAPIGLVAINAVPMATNQGFKSLVPNGRKVDSKFLYHWLRSKTSFLQGLGNGATFKEISKAVVERIEIPLPPLDEQRRIAAILDKADTLRRKRKRALDLLADLSQSIFSEMFNNVPQTLRISEMLSGGWLVLHKDGNHGSYYPRAEEFGDSGVPFLSAQSVDENGVINAEQMQYLKELKAESLKIGWIEKGDVLLAHNASVGKVALYQGEYDRCLIGTSLTCFRPNSQKLLPEYLFGALRSELFQAQLTKSMGQTTRNQVPITAQRELRLPIPEVSTQHKYAKAAASQMKHANVVRRAEGILEHLFSSLQHRAFSGQL